MTKSTLHLTVDTELIELAKNSNMNLSAEFEEWIKIRLNQWHKEESKEDPDLIIAKYRSEIMKLESQKEVIKQQEDIEKEKIMVLDNVIDNELKFFETGSDWLKIIDNRIHGIQYLYKKKFHIDLEVPEAREVLTNRVKERKLL